jgi:hypothetical protein
MLTQFPTKEDSSRLDSRTWKGAYRHIERQVSVTVERVSLLTGVSQRDLGKQVLMHLPRFSLSELSNASVIEQEVERLAERLTSLRRDFNFWQSRPQIPNFKRENFIFRPCSQEIARILHERFHYISSFHEGIAHLGLYDVGQPEIPMALASLAPMDIRVLYPLFPSARERLRTLVISRVFALEWAPRNTISYLLSQVSRWIRTNLPSVKSLFTFLNPNLGFSGSSFRASNWKLFLEVEPVASYLDGNYLTYRTLVNLTPVKRVLVKKCSYDLQPLSLMRYDLK